MYLSPPKTDTTLPVPTPMRVIQAQELHASLNQSPYGANAPILNILLSELDAEIRLKINKLEKKSSALIDKLPNKLKWCCRMLVIPQGGTLMENMIFMQRKGWQSMQIQLNILSRKL